MEKEIISHECSHDCHHVDIKNDTASNNGKIIIVVCEDNYCIILARRATLKPWAILPNTGELQWHMIFI